MTIGRGAQTIDVDSVPGDSERPMGAAEIVAKFVRYAAPALGPERASQLADACREAPLHANVRDLMTYA